MPGVIRTRVGYAGGTTQSPTYRSIGDHAETIQIDYDPARITYEDLLAAFWSGHDPTHGSWSRQYASIIFVHSVEQKRLAEASKAWITKERSRTVSTEIMPYEGFTLAENYHQKHSLQQFREFDEELRRFYPDPGAYVASTAVARLNGYLGGEGTYDALLREVDGFGLSVAGKKKLIELVQRQHGGKTCPVTSSVNDE